MKNHNSRSALNRFILNRLLLIPFFMPLYCGFRAEPVTVQRPYLESGLIFAHRGASYYEAENTIEAFDLALRQGADVLETDLQITKDSQIVLFHDRTLKRLTGLDQKIKDLTLKEIKQLKIETNVLQKGVQVPVRSEIITLEEAFIYFPATRMNLEIKDTQSDIILTELYRLIRKYNRQDSVLVSSADSDLNEQFRKLSSHTVATGAGTGDVLGFYFCYLFKLNCDPQFDTIQIPPLKDDFAGITLSSPGFIRYAKMRGLHVHYWTINDPDLAVILVRRGADGIMTDRPGLIAAALRSQTEKQE